ncbi:hypothetical protein WSM22_32110 [Cytophagales bacterium WSM2-2]|nr:hypothetical protein WSM22_32110 [Cytophagales bacterium WSM2-2]
MAEIVRMPKMSDTMTEGVIAKWHKKVGDTVKSGELMAEIETDKATMDYESFNTGTILYLGAKEGEPVKINDVLAIVGGKGEDFSSLLSGAQSSAAMGGKTEVKAETATAVATAPAIDTSGIKAEVALMPKMSDTMTEGIIAKWHKKVGDSVKSGELMAEIETDKATMDYESYNTGTLLYIGAKEKEAVKINDVLWLSLATRTRIGRPYSKHSRQNQLEAQRRHQRQRLFQLQHQQLQHRHLPMVQLLLMEG